MAALRCCGAAPPTARWELPPWAPERRPPKAVLLVLSALTRIQPGEPYPPSTLSTLQVRARYHPLYRGKGPPLPQQRAKTTYPQCAWVGDGAR